jgi:hypothetical protein
MKDEERGLGFLEGHKVGRRSDENQGGVEGGQITEHLFVCYGVHDISGVTSSKFTGNAQATIILVAEILIYFSTRGRFIQQPILD